MGVEGLLQPRDEVHGDGAQGHEEGQHEEQATGGGEQVQQGSGLAHRVDLVAAAPDAAWTRGTRRRVRREGRGQGEGLG